MSTQDTQKKPDWLDSPTIRTLIAVLPKVPLIVKTILFHLLKISENSQYWDLKTEVRISVMRSFLDPSRPKSILESQATTLRDPGIKGNIWISTVAAEVPPENHIRDTLLAVIDTMRGDKSSAELARIPEIAPIEAEWTGYREKATPDSPLPPISEAEKYEELMKECKSSATVLYFHGGAYYLCDPSSHRPLNQELAKLTGGRVYSVRYRLAPIHPFPSALLDALVSYFTLLYPPPGAIHEAVPASDIVFAGDSAGGNLSLALLQTILEIRRQRRQITWFGQAREVPLPAGATGCSPWVDIVQSMPSWEANARWDYLPSPARSEKREQASPPPPDAAWPADPPRKHLFVDDAYRLHPLVSLQFAPSWAGSPPVYVCCGWECLADEGRFIAAKMVRDGVNVVFEEYEAMPHVGALLLPHLEETRRNLRGWADFIRAAVADPKKIESSFTTVRAKTLQEVAIDPARLTPFSDDDVRQMARDRIGLEPPVPETRVNV